MDKTNEPISALADGELDAREAGFLIRRLSTDEGLLDQWQRHHALRACLQREYPGPVSLVERIREQLAAEPAPLTGGAGRWLKTGLGGAVAAGVAMLAVVGLGNRLENGATVEPVPEPAFVSQSTALDRQFSRRVEPAGFEGVRDAAATEQAGDRQRINRLMIRHSQMAGGIGFVTLAPILAEPTRVQVEVPSQSAEVDAAERRSGGGRE